jgi:hypothetical protein
LHTAWLIRTIGLMSTFEAHSTIPYLHFQLHF